MPGFIQLSSPEEVISQLILKFRTSEPNGLIFYAGNKDRTNYLTLSLAEGMLILRSAPGGEINSGEYSMVYLLTLSLLSTSFLNEK